MSIASGLGGFARVELHAAIDAGRVIIENMYVEFAGLSYAKEGESIAPHMALCGCSYTLSDTRLHALYTGIREAIATLVLVMPPLARVAGGRAWEEAKPLKSRLWSIASRLYSLLTSSREAVRNRLGLFYVTSQAAKLILEAIGIVEKLVDEIDSIVECSAKHRLFTAGWPPRLGSTYPPMLGDENIPLHVAVDGHMLIVKRGGSVARYRPPSEYPCTRRLVKGEFALIVGNGSVETGAVARVESRLKARSYSEYGALRVSYDASGFEAVVYGIPSSVSANIDLPRDGSMGARVLRLLVDSVSMISEQGVAPNVGDNVLIEALEGPIGFWKCRSRKGVVQTPPVLYNLASTSLIGTNPVLALLSTCVARNADDAAYVLAAAAHSISPCASLAIVVRDGKRSIVRVSRPVQMR